MVKVALIVSTVTLVINIACLIYARRARRETEATARLAKNFFDAAREMRNEAINNIRMAHGMPPLNPRLIGEIVQQQIERSNPNGR